MDVSSTTSSASSTSASQANAASAKDDSQASTDGSGAMISSDFTTFLTMLTTQIQNQDPLAPMDSTDFAVQLATFSGVEQQVRTNDLLAAVQQQLGTMNMSDLAGWVGMEAQAKSSAWFDGTPLTLQPDPASGAEATFVVVRDAAGNEVDRTEIPVSGESITWAGVTDTGDPFPTGLYSFYLDSTNQSGLISQDQMAVYSEIVEARSEDGQTILVLNGGEEVLASEVDALRAPDRSTTN